MTQPISILLCALGGEGGGVLTDWLVEAARHAGYPVQATSIPGVAQRTGATTYYLEIFPQLQSELGERRVVLGLNPLPGRLDLLVSSELLETARQVANGLSSVQRTRIITAGNRVLTTQEKMQMGDGRLDEASLLQVVQQQGQACHVLDMAGMTREAGTVVSAVMLGSMAACGLLPMQRRDYEAAIGAGSASQQASLRGFALGWEAVQQQRTQAQYLAELLPEPTISDAAPGLPETWQREFPAAMHEVLGHARARLLDYQDQAYVDLYRERLRQVLAREQQTTPAECTATQEVARWLALWMAFDDIVRVADLKSRAQRLERVRQEVKAKDDDVLRVYDHFKPGLPEIAALLPTAWAQGLLQWEQRRLARGLPAKSWPLKIGTHSVIGMLLLRMLASLRRVRRWGSRYAQEQSLIEDWLAAVQAGLQQSHALGLEMARCGRLIKGYGSTQERGRDNLLHILQHLGSAAATASPEDRARAIQQAREAALKDEAGTSLDLVLQANGAPARPLKVQPILWAGRRPRGLTQ
jgi:indolepyruvate ferredoxin oxidoreductase beta subunit